MHIYIIACTGARYNVYVHVQPMHAIVYWGVVKIIKTGWVAGWVAAIEKKKTL